MLSVLLYGYDIVVIRGVEASMVRNEHFEYSSFSNIEVFDIRSIRFFEVFDID